MTFVGLGVTAGAPAIGYLSDRVLKSRRRPYVLAMAAFTAFWACIALPAAGPPRVLLVPLLFLFGLAGSGYVVTWSLAREVNPPRYSGIATATVNAGGFLGAALLQGVLGRILDARWAGAIEAGARRYPPAAYREAFLYGLGALALATLLSLAVRETWGRAATE